MTQLKITNCSDLAKVREGLIQPDQVRSVIIEGLVDTGATMLVLPEDVVDQVGAPVLGIRRVRDARGIEVEVPWVGDLRIEILGREMTTDALVVPAGAQALIGQIPLEALDLIVDPKSREVHVNPASPDAPLLDLLGAA